LKRKMRASSSSTCHVSTASKHLPRQHHKSTCHVSTATEVWRILVLSMCLVRCRCEPPHQAPATSAQQHGFGGLMVPSVCLVCCRSCCCYSLPVRTACNSSSTPSSKQH
jgi:hypothetical protein